MRMTLPIIITSLITISPLAKSQTLNGFKGFSWGTHISTMSSPLNLKLYGRNNSDSTISYTCNVRFIGSVPLKQCFLNFYEDKFESVIITCEGSSNVKELLNIMKEVYGEESDLPASASIAGLYLWRTGKTTATYIKKSSDIVLVYFQSDSLAGVINANKKNRTKKSAKDF